MCKFSILIKAIISLPHYQDTLSSMSFLLTVSKTHAPGQQIDDL